MNEIAHPTCTRLRKRFKQKPIRIRNANDRTRKNVRLRMCSSIITHFTYLFVYSDASLSPPDILCRSSVRPASLSSGSVASSSVESSASAEALVRINSEPISLPSETSKKHDALNKQIKHRALAQVSKVRRALCHKFLLKHYCSHMGKALLSSSLFVCQETTLFAGEPKNVEECRRNVRSLTASLKRR